MPRIYDVIYAKCPYFRSSGKKNIVCEGITSGSTIILSFDTEDERNEHRRIFCNNHYIKCELCKAIDGKYME